MALRLWMVRPNACVTSFEAWRYRVWRGVTLPRIQAALGRKLHCCALTDDGGDAEIRTFVGRRCAFKCSYGVDDNFWSSRAESNETGPGHILAYVPARTQCLQTLH